MPRYICKDDDCMASIAVNHGFFWKSLWNHPDNGNLKEQRKNPNVLLANDIVYIPEKTKRLENGETEQRHKFRRKGIPSRMRIRLLHYGQPRAGIPYVFRVEQTTIEGQTDDDGCVSLPVPPEAKLGILTLRSDEQEEEVYKLHLGRLDPITEARGVQQRLQNLDIGCEVTGQLDDQTLQALNSFQSENKLPVSGVLDEATRKKLLEVHGS